MVIVGYVFTVINYILYCSSRFMKDKKNMVLFDIMAKISTVIGLWYLGSLTGSYNCAVSIVILVITYNAEKNDSSKKKDVFMYISFIFTYLLICILTFKGISSILVCTCSLMSLTSNWWLSPQGMRKLGIPANTIYLCYQISIKNWAGLLEIVVLMSNIISYVKYRKSRKLECNEPSVV